MEAGGPAPSAGRLARWAGLLAAYFTFQTANQVATTVAGLLVMRLLPVEEFALYALATSLLTFLTFVSNLGSVSAFNFYFRETTGEAARFAAYYRAVVEVRTRLLLLSLPAIAGALFWLGSRNGFSPAAQAISLLVIAVDAYALVLSTAQLTSLRLHGHLGPAYRAESIAAGARLTLVAMVVLALGWRRAVPALLILVVADGLAVATSRRGAPPAAAADTRRERREVWRFMAPTLPSELFAAFQGPLILWMAAAAGSARGVAEVGALGRLAQIFALLSTLGALVFLPRLAGVRDEALYRTRFLQFTTALTASAVGLVVVAWLGSDLLLAVLGPSYRGLEREMLVSVTTQGLGVVGSFAIWVNAARSWKRWQLVLGIATVLFQVAYVMLRPFATTLDYLHFGLYTALVMAVLQLGNALVGCWRPAWVKW